MPTHVVALQDRSVRASSPKFVGPSSGSLVALGFLRSPAPSGIVTKTRAIRELRREHRFGRESVSRASLLLALGFSGSPAPSDLVMKMRAIRKLRLEHGLSWDGQSSQLVAGASRRRATPRKVFDGPLHGCSSRAGANRADVHISEPRVGLAAYAWRFSSPTPMSFPLSRTPQANHSVNLRANGWPRYRAISFSLPRGQPLAPGYLER